MYANTEEFQIVGGGGKCDEENKAGPGVERDLEVGGGGSCGQGGQRRRL